MFRKLTSKSSFIHSVDTREKRIKLEQTNLTPLSWVTSRLKTQKSKAQSGPKGKKTIAALDGVRAIAALLVVSVHIDETAGLPWNLNGNPLTTSLAFIGRTGVDLFFILSGFLLFMPYARALLFQEKWPSARTFYLRRIFRIWPGYYFTLAAMILLFNQTYLQPAYWKRLGLFLTFFMDSSPKTWQRLDGPFWTLAIEWQFYMVLPLIALVFSLLVKRFASSPQQRLKALLACCLGLIVWGLFIRGLGLAYQRHPNLPFPLPHTILNIFLFFTFGIQGKYLEVFASGMIVCACYIFAQRPEFGDQLKAFLQRLSIWAWRLGWIILICIAFWQAQAEADRDATYHFTVLNFLNPLKAYYAWMGEPIAGVGYALCVLAILFGSSRLKWIFETRILGWIGMLSYGLYMWHLNLLLAFNTKILPHLPGANSILGKDLLLWAFIGVVIIPLSYIFYKTIEEPGIRLGAWLIKRISEPSHFHTAHKSTDSPPVLRPTD